jgi:hypothetical protein
MKLINKLRKYVHTVIFINKIRRTTTEALNEFNRICLEDFINTYEYANFSLKKWLYNSIKKVFTEVIFF